jgi:hypothetical protein
MKFCKDCKHYADDQCYHPKNVLISPVLGVARPAQSAEYLRQEHVTLKFKACEPEALWFEAKVAQAA